MSLMNDPVIGRHALVRVGDKAFRYIEITKKNHREVQDNAVLYPSFIAIYLQNYITYSIVREEVNPVLFFVEGLFPGTSVQDLRNRIASEAVKRNLVDNDHRHEFVLSFSDDREIDNPLSSTLVQSGIVDGTILHARYLGVHFTLRDITTPQGSRGKDVYVWPDATVDDISKWHYGCQRHADYNLYCAPIPRGAPLPHNSKINTIPPDSTLYIFSRLPRALFDMFMREHREREERLEREEGDGVIARENDDEEDDEDDEELGRRIMEEKDRKQALEKEIAELSALYELIKTSPTLPQHGQIVTTEFEQHLQQLDLLKKSESNVMCCFQPEAGTDITNIVHGKLCVPNIRRRTSARLVGRRRKAARLGDPNP